MTFETILRRDDGSRVRILVAIRSASWAVSPVWYIECATCERGKRTWVPAVDIDDPKLRRLSTAEHNRYVRKANLRVATSAEIESAMRALLSMIEVKYE